MAWNEPGGNGGRDPWGSRGQGSGPPDLDELIRRMQQRLNRFFGGGSGGGGGGGGNASVVWLLVLILALLALIYEVSYVIQPAERGVVLRFGRYATTLEPGLNIRLPRPIERVIKVDVDQVRLISHNATMLTEDENIVDIELSVQYRVKNVRDYLFNVRAPDATVRQATETSVREVIGTSKMDTILTEGRALVENRSKASMQEILDSYGAGLVIASVNMQPAKPPEQVKSAFDEVIKAREDEQRLINEAQAYRNEILPKARGGAARQVAEAEAYRERVVNRAEGETSRFVKILSEYEQAPAVTRERLYIDAIEDVLAKTPKVMIDTSGSANIMYLPLDKMLERAGMAGGADDGESADRDSSSGSGLTAETDRRERANFGARSSR